ncbi:kelch repeat and BTB domain-containing protein 2-like [Amphiura filiformis]|uniref:kelch repeat and BTB domain-containing protein 2-like n=1 Tax=Amphiura filiformis TaxID=82378 RepID=UPI003B20DE91
MDNQSLDNTDWSSDPDFIECVGDTSHALHLASGLNQLRQEGVFCDVTIIVNKQRFPVHKAVLSASSNFFMKVFASNGHSDSEVVVQGHAETFTKLLDFAYLGVLKLSQNTVCDIFRMACHTGFTEAVQLCAKYLVQKQQFINLEDTFKMLELAEGHEGLKDLKEAFSLRLLHNFNSFAETMCFLEQGTKEFLMNCLSAEEIEHDASDDEDDDDIFGEIETNGCKEEKILQATLNWLKYNWVERQCYAADLLKKIRLGWIPDNRLMPMLGDEVLAIPECKELVEELVKLHAKDSVSVPLIQSHPDMFATRNTITATLWSELDSAYLGFDDQDQTSFMYCHPSQPSQCYKLNKFAQIPNYEETAYIYSSNGQRMLVTEQGTLYVAGGIKVVQAGGTTFYFPKKDFFEYQSEPNEWIRRPEMLHDHFHPALVELDGYIYAIGGMRLDSILSNDVERFNLTSQTWEEVSPLIRKDWFYLSACVYNGYILAIGSSISECKSCTQVYNPNTNAWTVVLETTSTHGECDQQPQFIVHNRSCYYVCKRRCPSQSNTRVVVRSVIFNLESDNPSIILGNEVDLKLEWKDLVKSSVTFTFDKRKLGSSLA